MPFSWVTALVVGFFCGLLVKRALSQTSDRRSRLIGPSRNQLLTWLDQVPLGWLIVDSRDRVQFINTRAQRLLEIPKTEKPPLFLDELDGISNLLDVIESAREHDQPQRIEWDRGEQELEIFTFVGEGESVAVLLQSRRSLEAQLSQQERWVSDVAHELKTPLTALLLVGDSLAATVTDRNAVLVERLLKELRRMQDLVGDLLELSRLENVLPGKGISLVRIHVPHLLREAWQGVKPLAEQKQVKLEMALVGQDSEVSIMGDGKRLHRALLNLFDNALRYSPEKGTIWVDLHTSAEWVRIGIQDAGPGLSENDLEHMFERFYRGDASRFRQQRGGSGLGLAIVQQIVLTHGGWVFGENAPGGGARFEVRLPISPDL
jgi:two-component system phosphate regulon sensor histidine kinase PhoR